MNASLGVREIGNSQGGILGGSFILLGSQIFILFCQEKILRKKIEVFICLLVRLKGKSVRISRFKLNLNQALSFFLLFCGLVCSCQLKIIFRGFRKKENTKTMCSQKKIKACGDFSFGTFLGFGSCSRYEESLSLIFVIEMFVERFVICCLREIVFAMCCRSGVMCCRRGH